MPQGPAGAHALVSTGMRECVPEGTTSPYFSQPPTEWPSLKLAGCPATGGSSRLAHTRRTASPAGPRRAARDVGARGSPGRGRRARVWLQKFSSALVGGIAWSVLAAQTCQARLRRSDRRNRPRERFRAVQGLARVVAVAPSGFSRSGARTDRPDHRPRAHHVSHQQYDAAFRTDRVRSPYPKTGERSKHTSMRAEWFSNVHDLTAPR